VTGAAGGDTSDMLKMARMAFLACGAPAAPTVVPDGATATREQMVSAHATVKAFDEATALLAGDTLQTLAFLALSQSPLAPAQITAQMQALSIASVDMAVGQALDIEAEGKRLDLPALERVHRLKTGALIRASVNMGAIAAGAGTAALAALDIYADRLGLAFQVHDDVLDVIGDTLKIGKRAGADIAREKSTYPALLGLEAAQALAIRLHDEAIAALAPLGKAATPLHALANFLVARDH